MHFIQTLISKLQPFDHLHLDLGELNTLDLKETNQPCVVGAASTPSRPMMGGRMTPALLKHFPLGRSDCPAPPPTPAGRERQGPPMAYKQLWLAKEQSKLLGPDRCQGQPRSPLPTPSATGGELSSTPHLEMAQPTNHNPARASRPHPLGC